MTTLAQIPQLNIDAEQIAAFCEKWGIAELSVFGSVLRDDFGPESDVDVLFVPKPETEITLDYLWKAEEELAVLFGRRVDFIEKEQVQRDPNYIRRRIILNSARILYTAS
jgi:predicted nucleotidyltransferase